jgi:hypothetical protein
MPHRSVRRSLAVAAASLCVVATACGATGGADGGSKVVASAIAPKAQQAAGVVEAAKATGAVQTEKVAVTVRTDSPGGDPSVEVTATGAIDGANGRAHLTADLSGTMGGRSQSTTIEALYDGDAIYVKAPFVADLVGKPWVQVTSPQLGSLADQLGGGLQGDPGSFLELLEGAGGPVTTVGTEDVRGVPTRHVRVDLDVAKLLDRSAGERRQELRDQLARRGVDLAELAPLPAEAWIDDDGYVRRFSVSFDLAEVGKLRPGADARGVVTETIELYDFGAPVEIAVPAASEVATFDLTDLLQHGNELGAGPGAGHGN